MYFPIKNDKVLPFLFFFTTFNNKFWIPSNFPSYAPINVKPAGGILINRFGPGVGHLNYLAVPGVGIFEFLSVPVTRNHFPGWEIQ